MTENTVLAAWTPIMLDLQITLYLRPAAATRKWPACAYSYPASEPHPSTNHPYINLSKLDQGLNQEVMSGSR